MTDENFENYLREFEPRKPRALPIELIEKEAGGRFDGVKRLAAAAAVILVCGASLWTGLQQAPTASTKNGGVAVAPKKEKSRLRRSSFELTKAALEDSAKFEAALEQEARGILPRFDGPDSALRVLAKE